MTGDYARAATSEREASKKRRRGVPLLTAAVALVVGVGLLPPVANAAEPPCGPDDYDQPERQRLTFNDPLTGEASVPATVPVGGRANAEVYVGDSVQGPDPSPNLVALRQATNAPISHPTTTTVPNDDSVEHSFPKVRVQFERGDGPAVVIVQKDIDSNRPGVSACRATLYSHPIVPVKPRVQLSRGFPKTGWYDNRKRRRDVEFEFDKSLCGDATARGAFRIDRRVTIRVRSKPGCVWKSRVRSARGVTLDTPGGIYVSADDRRHSRHRVRYRITGAGKTIRRGSFRLATALHRGYRGRRIYESQFDDYVNICINGNYKIRASGGRLYCYVPGDPRYWYTRVTRLR